jgi:hypothetical protein
VCMPPRCRSTTHGVLATQWKPAERDSQHPKRER